MVCNDKRQTGKKYSICGHTIKEKIKKLNFANLISSVFSEEKKFFSKKKICFKARSHPVRPETW